LVTEGFIDQDFPCLLSLKHPYARVPIQEEADIAIARILSRELAAQQGLPPSAIEALATAVSEIASNIVLHAGAGEILFGGLNTHGGVVVVARDRGPGIPDLELAIQDGYSTKNGLGLGLASARRLMDEFELVSTVGEGTVVTMMKRAR
jgi:serine/threonine-protein kinase RsbT